MDAFYYRKLEVYQSAKALTKQVCNLLKAYPTEERFALCLQLRRAVMSVPINIAEGFGRFSYKEKAHFIEIAYGSLTEVLCELELSFDLHYISEQDFRHAEEQITVIAKQLSGLHASVIRNGSSRFSPSP
ncbi:MAG TPA: four helix bundle protein [Prevotella sp.]